MAYTHLFGATQLSTSTYSQERQPGQPSFRNALAVQVLMAAISATQHGQDNIRELACILVLALAKHHGPMFEPVLDVVVQPLLQGCADGSREVKTCLSNAYVCSSRPVCMQHFRL